MDENKDTQNNNSPSAPLRAGQNSYWDKPLDDVSLDEYKKDREKELDELSEAGLGDGRDEKAGKKPEKDSVKRYKNAQGLALWKLKAGLWYVEHKSHLRMAVIGLLILVSAVGWTYTIYGFAYYLSKGMQEDNALADQVASSGFINHDAILQFSPKDLSFGQIGILGFNNRYDFFVKVANPNEMHGAEFEYYFIADGEKTKANSGFILPKESKYLLSLANELDFNPADVRLQFSDFKWKKIDKHEISDWDSFSEERLKIITSDEEFIPANQSGLSDELSLNNLEFNALNETVYNYWGVDFTILLYSGLNIAGVNKYAIDEFMSGQKRHAAISWTGPVGRINKVEIIPEINILKDDIYIKYESGAGEEK